MKYGVFRRLLLLVPAWLFVNALLTFENIWPTLGVRPALALSVEAALIVLVVAWLVRRGPLSRGARAGLAALVVLFALTRYADVTAKALYGRPLNLYWDAEHLPRVAAMLAAAASPLQLAMGAVACVAVLAALYLVARLALGGVAAAVALPGPRRVVSGLAAAIAVLYGAGLAFDAIETEATFAEPVASAYLRQGALLVEALGGAPVAAAGAALPAHGSLDALRASDVFLIFLESYGAATYTLAEHRDALAASRAELAAAIAATGRAAVSAYVTSPTFGGASWLAHASLLSGRETRTPEAYHRLVSGHPDTLVHAFAQHGYRTVALMPGLRQAWPEGAAYGFDAVYGAEALAYRGPAFGWWRIPDQYALAKLDAEESSRAPRRPLFVFFPTITSHAPFRPTPPYQADWARLTSEQPYDAHVRSVLKASATDWDDLGPAYAASVGYTLRSLAGYLRHRADRDLVLIVLGDHQPPAGVAGAHASWDVPVHVIANRRELVEPLRARGFADGLEPHAGALGPMHALAAVLLDAFGSGGGRVRTAEARVDVARPADARPVPQ